MNLRDIQAVADRLRVEKEQLTKDILQVLEQLKTKSDLEIVQTYNEMQEILDFIGESHSFIYRTKSRSRKWHDNFFDYMNKHQTYTLNDMIDYCINDFEDSDNNFPQMIDSCDGILPQNYELYVKTQIALGESFDMVADATNRIKLAFIKDWIDYCLENKTIYKEFTFDW